MPIFRLTFVSFDGFSGEGRLVVVARVEDQIQRFQHVFRVAHRLTMKIVRMDHDQIQDKSTEHGTNVIQNKTLTLTRMGESDTSLNERYVAAGTSLSERPRQPVAGYIPGALYTRNGPRAVGATAHHSRAQGIPQAGSSLYLSRYNLFFFFSASRSHAGANGR